MARPLQWGVIGTGGIARAFAADLRLTTSGTVAAVGSRTREAAARFASDLGVERAHGSYEALVADPAVEAVYVATPHPWHHPNALLALEAGKPVLVEKPFMMNATEARELVAAARARRLFLMEAMWTRFLPHVHLIRRLLAEGALGEVIAVHATHGQAFPPDAAHRLFAPELGGGALLDLGVYPVSFASMVLGRPKTITALVSPAMTGVDGHVSMAFGYGSGAHALLSCTSLGRMPNSAAIVGTDACIEIAASHFPAPSWFTLVTRAGERTRFDEPHEGSGLRHQADEVARCLTEGELESPLMSLDETVAVMETMDEVLAGAG